MFFHVGQAFLETVFFDDCIGIQQKDVLALAFFEGLVVSFAKTKILFALDQSDLRKKSLYHLHGMIRARIVHNKDFRIDGFGCFEDRMKALLQIGSHIVVDDDNRELQGQESSIISTSVAS